MKMNIKSLYAICTAALLAGCTDLDVNIESQYTQYPINDIAVEAKNADVYFHLRDVFGRRYMEAMSLSSDEYTAVSYGGGWYDSGCYSHPSLHDFRTEDASIDWMPTVISGITKANTVIRDLGGEEAVPADIAPARAMRAFFTFIIMDCWGDVPILDYLPVTNDEVVRAPRAEVARWIESELLEIIPQLTDEVSDNTYGKPTKWMAEALLAKLYINWAVYTASSVEQYEAATAENEKLNDCIRICDDIIASGKFNLGSMPYAEKFGPDNGSQVEDFIYAMPYDTYTATGMQYGRARTWKNAGDVEKSYYGMKLSNSAGGYITMNPEFSRLFCLEGDIRNNSVIGDTVHVYDPNTYQPTSEIALDENGKPIVLTQTVSLEIPDDVQLGVGDNTKGYSQGYRSVKFFVIDDDYKNGRNQSNDLPIFRYADILLTKAEAIVRGGTATNGETAMSLFNQIREYAQAPLLATTPSLQDLLDERGREFFDENWRRNDMIRFGTFENEYGFHKKDFPTARFEKTCRIFPLHRDVLNTYPHWTQNQGY